MQANVALTITSNDRPVKLDGIIVKEQRRGWVTLDVPPLEAWDEPLRWATRQQRERIESPEFYQWLQATIGQRFRLLQRRLE